MFYLMFLALAGKDYYRILKVEKTAAQEDIRKSYRKLSMKFHPDRAQDDDEKEAYRSKYQDINNAFSVLSDKRLKEIYDKAQFSNGMGEEAIKSLAEAEHAAEQRKHFDPLAADFDPRKEIHIKEKADPRVDYFNVSFLQALKGHVDTYYFTQHKTCRQCKGSGSKDKNDFQKCSICQGRGQYDKDVELLPGIFAKTHVVCSKCSGHGHLHEESCDKCSGSGFVDDENSVFINVKPGMYHEYQEVFDDMGDAEHEDPKLPVGDLIVEFNVSYEESYEGVAYFRKGQNIFTKVKAPDGAISRKRSFDLFGVRTVEIDFEDFEAGERIVVKGQGFPKFGLADAGDFIVILE